MFCNTNRIFVIKEEGEKKEKKLFFFLVVGFFQVGKESFCIFVRIVNEKHSIYSCRLIENVEQCNSK
jgi:hypothetical protein